MNSPHQRTNIIAAISSKDIVPYVVLNNVCIVVKLKKLFVSDLNVGSVVNPLMMIRYKSRYVNLTIVWAV